MSISLLFPSPLALSSRQLLLQLRDKQTAHIHILRTMQCTYLDVVQVDDNKVACAVLIKSCRENEVERATGERQSKRD